MLTDYDDPVVGSWGFRFACECVSQVTAKTLTASVPSYSTVLDLDATVRDYPMPEFPADMPPVDPNKPSVILARYTLAHTKETSESSFYIYILQLKTKFHVTVRSPDVHPSQFLRSGHDRRSRESAAQPIRPVIPGDVQIVCAYLEMHS